MAVDSYDPITGAPQFSDGGAPDIAVDPTEVAKYAADVGNRIVRANLAALDAYAYKRAGLGGHALDTGVEYIYDGSGWRQVGTAAWVTVTTFGGGWSETGGYTVQIRRFGNTVEIRGAATSGSGSSFANILTVPEGYRPPANRWVGASHASVSGAMGMLFIAPTGVLQVPSGYRTGSGAAGIVWPLAGSWSVD